VRAGAHQLHHAWERRQSLRLGRQPAIDDLDQEGHLVEHAGAHSLRRAEAKLRVVLRRYLLLVHLAVSQQSPEEAGVDELQPAPNIGWCVLHSLPRPALSLAHSGSQRSQLLGLPVTRKQLQCELVEPRIGRRHRAARGITPPPHTGISQLLHLQLVGLLVGVRCVPQILLRLYPEPSPGATLVRRAEERL
jgi:hypothetical protein